LDPSPTPRSTDDPPGRTAAQTVAAIFAILFYQGYTMAINAIAAPWVARSFALSQSGIAAVYACISVSAIGALILSRYIDRLGRRRVLLWCMTATPLCALAAAVPAPLPLFVAFEIMLYGFIGATVSGSVVMFAEALPVEQRAKGQSYGGVALGLGAGLCVIFMPLLADAGYSWRWLLVLSGAGLLGLPLLASATPESAHWQRAAANGSTAASRFSDLFASRYRHRAVPLLASQLLSQIAAAAVMNWSYYHAVSVVGLPAAAASVMVLVAGGIGLLGYPLGARLCERFGRVPTVVVCDLLLSAGALWFYWGPPLHVAYPGVWLGIGFFWFTAAGNGAMVGTNAAATELFPTSVRATVIGWFTLVTAVAAVFAQGIMAALAVPLGGLSSVVGYLSLLATPSAVVFGMFIDETRGLALDMASQEATVGSGR
jgi:MFS family permease